MKLETLSGNTTIIAIHPNYIVDAAAAAQDKFSSKRLKILINYINKFKIFIQTQLKSGAKIIITLMGDPYQLENWSDQELEQEQAVQIHQDLMGFINKIGSNPSVHISSEESAGDACRRGEFKEILVDSDRILLIGGNLTGCLKNTLEVLKSKYRLNIKVLEELTFDDDVKFWSRDY